MKNNNRIHVPGNVNIGVQFHPGLNADPVIVQLNSPDSTQVFVTGGESKPERHAVALLAGLLANPDVNTGDRDGVVEKAVDMAYRVQAALAERAKAESKPAENGKMET